MHAATPPLTACTINNSPVWILTVSMLTYSVRCSIFCKIKLNEQISSLQHNLLLAARDRDKRPWTQQVDCSPCLCLSYARLCFVVEGPVLTTTTT